MLRQTNLEHPALPKPDWLRVRAPGGGKYVQIRDDLRRKSLHTVCEEARCPNIGECWSGGTATFMLLGDTCTRACAFCAVKTGNPRGRIDLDEPRKLADSVADSGLEYVVLTMVDRDDLEDGGAGQIAASIDAIRERSPEVLIEILSGDLRGQLSAIRQILDSGPDVFGHNVETVERLSPEVRDRRASYRTSLDILASAKSMSPTVYTKSSIMLGVGERESEVIATMKDLRERSVDLLTIGQYLRPSPRHLPVAEYVFPDQFDRLRDIGLELGFSYVAAGPLVRSSYRAGEYFVASQLRRNRGAAAGLLATPGPAHRE